MRILFVIPYAPSKIRVRSYEFILHLTARGHAITLLTLVANAFDQGAVDDLRQAGIDVIAYPLPAWRSLLNCSLGLFTPDPLQSYYCWHPGLANHLIQLASTGDARGRFDLIHLEHMRSARFGHYLRRHLTATDPANQCRTPLIWDSVDCISYLFRQAAHQNRKFVSRMINRFELGRSRRYEGKIAILFDRVLITSQIDRNALLELIPGEAAPPCIDIVPNGADIHYFQPGPFESRDDRTLVISGKMSYHANVAMVLYLYEQILPLVWAQKPEVKVSIIGKDPPREIKAMSTDPRIFVSGYVADLRPYLQKATAAVAPLTYGAGSQNKVLEAMACATPTVTTPRAVSALAAIPGSDLLVGNTPEEFAGHVIRLLEDQEYRRNIGEAGRRFVVTYHHWGSIAQQLENIYMDEVQRQRI